MRENVRDRDRLDGRGNRGTVSYIIGNALYVFCT